MKELPWSAFKSFVQSRYLSVQYVDVNDHYYMWAFDGPVAFECVLYKDGSSDIDDFEDNFKAAGNKSFSDNDGMPLQRLKMAASGAKFKTHMVYFKTADLDSMKEQKESGTSFSYSVLKLYDTNGTEITSSTNEGNATRTVIQFEPTFTYEIIGGGAYQKEAPASTIVCNAVFAPTVSEAYGGKVHFLNECHLDMLGSGKVIDIDGYVAKKITYDATYHSGRFDFIFDHNAGLQHELLVFIKIFIT